MTPPLSPDLMLSAYANGVFPMAEGQNDAEVFWVDPKQRGVFPLEGFYTSRSLRKHLRRAHITCHINTDFNATVAACANRAETWINADLRRVYGDLHRIGHAHSFEVSENGARAGGVFGVTLGRAFFGESMFSLRPNGSKIALKLLIDHLKAQGFTLFDTQFLTDHLASLGAVEIPRREYHRRLQAALQGHARFTPHPDNAEPTGHSGDVPAR